MGELWKQIQGNKRLEQSQSDGAVEKGIG